MGKVSAFTRQTSSAPLTELSLGVTKNDPVIPFDPVFSITEDVYEVTFVVFVTEWDYDSVFPYRQVRTRLNRNIQPPQPNVSHMQLITIDLIKMGLWV